MFELFSTILAQSQTAPSEGTSKVLTPTVLLGIFLVGAALVLAITWRIRTVHLALGFATTVLMWAVGYFAMLAPNVDRRGPFSASRSVSPLRLDGSPVAAAHHRPRLGSCRRWRTCSSSARSCAMSNKVPR